MNPKHAWHKHTHCYKCFFNHCSLISMKNKYVEYLGQIHLCRCYLPELQALSANWFRDNICNSISFELLSVKCSSFLKALGHPANSLPSSLRLHQDLSLWQSPRRLPTHTALQFMSCWSTRNLKRRTKQMLTSEITNLSFPPADGSEIFLSDRSDIY